MFGFGAHLKKVIAGISQSTGLDFIDPKISVFESEDDVQGFTKISGLHALNDFQAPTIDSKKCLVGLARILYLINRGGDPFDAREKESIFFSATRLFQSSSPQLRRMTHLLFRTLEVSPDVSFVITSVLSKDINSDDLCLRANALRTIVRILNQQTAVGLERQLNTAIVSEKGYLASTALLCCLHLQNVSPELVKRSLVQIAGQVNSPDEMVQAHAIQVLGEINKADKLAMHRSVVNFASTVMGNPIAETYLIAQCRRLLDGGSGLGASGADSSLDESLLEFLNLELSRSGPYPMVALEAAKTAIYLALECPKFSGDPERYIDIPLAMNILRESLSHEKDIVRYAAIRVMYMIAQKQPQFLYPHFDAIGVLLSDSCKPVAVLSLITMLKCDVDHDTSFLMKQIGDLMCDVSDAQKVEIIAALEESCVVSPTKAPGIIKFISAQLREEGGKTAKWAAAAALTRFATTYKSSKFTQKGNDEGFVRSVHEEAVSDLCEFIEDCEFASLMIFILAFLGEQIPQTQNPALYLRYVVNRAILEVPDVQCAAVDAMSTIAQHCPTLRSGVIATLKGHLQNDSHDEVREFVHYTLKLLEPSKSPEPSVEDLDDQSTAVSSLDDLLIHENSELAFSVDALLDECTRRLAYPELPVIDVKELPTPEEYEESKMVAARKMHAKAGLIASLSTVNAASGSGPASTSVTDKLIESISRYSDGAINLKSVTAGGERPELLTEAEAEYLVKTVKYVCDEGRYIVFQVSVTNTIAYQTLEDVKLKMTLGANSEVVQIRLATGINKVPCNVVKHLWVVLELAEGARLAEQLSQSDICIGTTLMYNVREDDGDDAFPDEYQMSEMRIRPSDALIPQADLAVGDVMHSFTQLADTERLVRVNFGTERAPHQIFEVIKKLPNTVFIETPTGVAGQMLTMHNVLEFGAVYTLFHIVSAPNKGTLGKVAIRAAASPAFDLMARLVTQL